MLRILGFALTLLKFTDFPDPYMDFEVSKNNLTGLHFRALRSHLWFQSFLLGEKITL